MSDGAGGCLGAGSRGGLLALVGLSLVMLFLVIAYRNGLGATPYNTMDSAGRTMGFNDEFSHEHYRIIVGNMHLDGLGIYEGGLVVAHLVMAGLLIWCRKEGEITSFAWLQFFCFPWGFFGFLNWPFYVMGYFEESNDRESVVDIPFVQAMAGAVWLAVSAFIIWRMRRRSQRQALTGKGD